MTSVPPRLVGTHHHYLTNLVGPGTTFGEAIYGLVKNFINNEGADLELGDVVKIDAAGDDFVEKTETLSDPLVVGVVASAGPIADGDPVAVLIMGYHSAVKVTGSVSRGDYLTASATDGTAETMTPGSIGAFARATREDDSGTVAAIVFEPELGGAPTLAFTDLSDVPSSYSGEAGKAVAVNGAETGLEFVDFPSGGSPEYDPKRAPASPSSLNDEFDDLSLDAKWSTGSSGGGSSGNTSETQRKGFFHTDVTDGGAGSARWIDQAVSIAAGLWTMMAHVYGNVGGAGSNQVNIELTGGSFVVGMLNGTQAIINGPSGFSAHNRTYITGNYGEIWLMIQHDAGTGMDGWVSGDGMIWTRLTGMTSSGTVTNIRLVAVAFSSSYAEAWWDCFRYFAGVKTFDIGGTP